MAIGSSLSGQLGMAIETTPGTRVAPTKWLEFTGQGFTAGRKTIRSKAIGGGGSIARPWGLLGQEPGGSLQMEAAPENIGTLLRLCFGTPVTTGAGPYVHTYSFSLSNPLPSATFQVGMPDVGGTVRAFDYVGMRAASWEMSVNPDDWVMASYDLVGQRVVTDQTLGTPTWPTLTPWTSIHAALTVLGGTSCFDSLTLRGDNALDISSVVCTTNPGERKVRQKGRPTLGGTLVWDFSDMTAYTAFSAGTIGDLVLTLNAGTSAKLIVTGRIQIVEDNTPTMSGAEEILKQSSNFEFVRDGATTDSAAFNVALTTTVATV